MSRYIYLFIFTIFLFCSVAIGQIQSSDEVMEGELIVSFVEGTTQNKISNILNNYDLNIVKSYQLLSNTFHVRKTNIKQEKIASEQAKKEIIALIENIKSNGEINSVEPNYILYATAIPNDTGMDGVYAMNNYGQTGGTIDSDIDAVEAWDIETGNEEVIVGVIDSGIDYDHPDLENNMWVNTGEIPGNGIDDDSNGYIDDVYGWDWAYGDNDPSDYAGHGTHCAGTIGAIGNNGEGVVGVAWNVKLMALKFLNDSGSGSTANAISAVEYATQMGATLTSNSWGGGSYSSALETAIANSNILFIAAAGNSGSNNDSYPHYPSSYELDNVIAVASTDHNDNKASTSCYGATSVDLGAPGVDILSTKPDNSTYIPFGSPGWGLSSDYYGIISGTSMAAPAVSGTAALLYSRNSSISWEDAKNAILDNVDPVASMSGITVTGGRLNTYNALQSVRTGLIASNDTLNYGIVSVNETKEKTISFFNAADSALTVSFTSNLSEYSPNILSHYLEVNEIVEIIVSFNPTSVGEFDGVLSCIAGDTTISVLLTGEALYLPVIDVDPNTLSFDLNSNDSLEQTITINNTGMEELIWSIPGMLENNVQKNQYPFSYYNKISKDSKDSRIGNEVITTTGGPDSYGYTWIDSNEDDGLVFDWKDISATGIPVNGLSDDNFVGPFPIGFNFNYYGEDYSEFYIGSNGIVGFGPSEGYDAHNNDPLPWTNAPNNILAWFWDDLSVQSGNVYYQNNENELVIQFDSYEEFGTSETVTAEVILYSNGTIKFQYLDFSDGIDVLHSTVGIENQDGSSGLEVVFNNSYLHDSLAIQFGTNQWLAVSPSSGSISPGSSEEITVTANSRELIPALYQSYISIINNDEDQNPYNIPVSLSVESQQITFSVDMSIYEEVGYFNPSLEDYVAIAGDFNNWEKDTQYQLAHEGGSIYSGAFPFYGQVGDLMQYKFFIHPGDGRILPNDGWEETVGSYGENAENRGFILNGNSQTIPTFFFNNRELGFPEIVTAPDSLEFTLFEGDSTNLLVTLENVGESNLIWDAGFTYSDTENLAMRAKKYSTKDKPLSFKDSLQLNLIKNNYIKQNNSIVHKGMSSDQDFFDGFEDGTYNKWTVAGGSYSREVVTETAPEGNYCYKQTGYGDHFSGIYTNFEQSTLPSISFFVKPTSIDAHCYFVIGDEYFYDNAGIIFFYAVNNIFKIYANESNMLEIPHVLNEWYFIEFRNINYLSKTYDVYVNSELITEGFPFRSQTSNYVNTLYLYNITNSTGFYDHIAVGETNFKPWITAVPDSGMVEPAGSQELQVKVNAKDLNHGSYFKNMVVNSNDPRNISKSIPISVNVLMKNPPVISVNPDSIIAEVAEGDSTIKILNVQNNGTGNLEWELSKSYEMGKKLNYELTVPKVGKNSLDEREKIQEHKQIRKEPINAKLNDLAGVNILYDVYHGQNSSYDWSTIINDLELRNATVTENYETITSAVLANYDVLWIIEHYNSFSSSEISAVQEWLRNGGALLLEGDEDVYNFNSILTDLNSGILYSSSSASGGVTTNIFPHQTTEEVFSLYTSPMGSLSEVTSPATLIANDSYNSNQLIAAVQIESGRIFSMADEIFGDWNMGYEDNQLFANQVFDWLAMGSSEWLTISPTSGTIAPTNTHEIKLNLNSQNIEPGNYNAILTINSNDPVTSELTIPTHFSVIGTPNIFIQNDSLNFNNVFVAYPDTQLLTIENVGTDLLTVTNISSNNENFLVENTTISLLKDESYDIPVAFYPTSAGFYSGLLTIESNDPDEPSFDIFVEGSGIEPPHIIVTPDSLYDSLLMGDTLSRSFTINNTGLSNLEFEIYTSETELTLKRAEFQKIYNEKYKNSTIELNRNISSKDHDSEPTISIPGSRSKSDTNILVIQDSYAWGTDMNTFIMQNFGIQATVINSNQISSTNFSNYNIIITTGDQSSTYYSYISNNVGKFEEFVLNGGIVQYQLATQGDNVNIVGGTQVLYGNDENYNTVLLPDHPIVEGLDEMLQGNAANHSHLYNFPENALVITETAAGSDPTTIEYSFGLGTVVATGMTWEYLVTSGFNSGPMLFNATAYSLSKLNVNWLTVTPHTGIIQAEDSIEITVDLDATSLNIGDYSANITIVSNDPSASVVELPITISVEMPDPPVISVTPDSIELELTEGDSSVQMIQISNSGAGNLNWELDVEYFYKKSNFSETTDLYEQYKHLTAFEQGSDENNSGNAKKAPIPMDKISQLTGHKNILAWTLYADMSREYPNTINAISQYFTDYTITTTTTTDASALESQLADIDVFLIPEQESGTISTFTSLGNSWQTVLQNFVEDGGTIILCGSGNGSHEILNSSEILLLDYYSYFDGNMDVVDPYHPVTNGLPSSIPTQSATYFYDVSDPEAEILITKNGYTSVAAKTYGNGNVILIGYDYYNYDDNAALIISNAVQMDGGYNWITFSASEGTVLPDSDEELMVTFNSSHLTAGSYVAYIGITSNDPDNNIISIPICVLVDSVEVGIGSENLGEIPDKFMLSQNYPNPFNPETTIKYQLPKASTVTINIYNVMGQKVCVLVNKYLQAGYYHQTWDGKNEQGHQVSSGIYFYQINAGEYIKTMKMLMLK